MVDWDKGVGAGAIRRRCVLLSTGGGRDACLWPLSGPRFFLHMVNA